MFKKLRKNDLMVEYLDEQIEYTAGEMLKQAPDSDEYRKTNEQFMRLIQARDEKVNGKKISPETWLMVGANIGGILLVLHYEQLHVVSSKAFSWVVKPKM